VNASSNIDPRAKVLQTALELFAKFGYEGTSIRMIATQSGVNLSAVNYHFSSKENLYWEIVAQTYQDLEQKMELFSRDSTNTLELVAMMFDCFCHEYQSFRAIMKMMLEDSVGEPKSEEVRKMLMNPMGPPGGQLLGSFVEKDVGRSLSKVEFFWAIKSIFGSVIHWATMECSSHVIQSRALDDDVIWSKEQIRKDVIEMVNSTLFYLKNKK
jgi:AcrR family transcriptional regulator